MSKDYEIVIGLEVHAELETKTKIFCGCKNEFGAEVNTQCCPICMGLPGTLPVLNEKVVEFAIKAGLALNCDINRISKQDRKNYFYPDLPKAYQVSQYDIPICEKGHIEILLEDRVKTFGITRIHIEEDAGKLLHDDSFSGTLVDFNRCGVPLIEIVSEPDMRSSQEAKAFLENIRLTLMSIGVCDGKMEEGSIRCDINVSVRERGAKEFGTRVEMKNVNTISGTVRAVEYEAQRQIEAIENGETISQETRRWDDLKNTNVLLRSKENAQDYRFFPEPDLLNIVLTEEEIENLKNSITELPNHKIIRYTTDYKLSKKEAEQLVFQSEKSVFFESVLKANDKIPAKTVANWVLGDVSRVANEKDIKIADMKITALKMGKLISLIEDKTISNAAGKEIFNIIAEEDRDIEEIMKEKNLVQISDNSVLETIAEKVLEENPKAIEDYRNGKTNILGFLVGQCMKQSKGQGNPGVLKEIIINKIG